MNATTAAAAAPHFCLDGWLPMIEVRDHGRVVEHRPVDPYTPEEIERQSAVGRGQVAAEVFVGCRVCQPGWKHPDERLERQRAQREAAQRDSDRRRSAFDQPDAIGRKGLSIPKDARYGD